MADQILTRLPEQVRVFLKEDESPLWTIASFAGGLLAFALINFWFNQEKVSPQKVRKRDAASTDPGLVRKGTSYEVYETPSGYVYPKIRTFFSTHPQAKKLPADLPLLVFMHGLGGSVAQFAPLLTSLVNTAPCLAIDLPGCGLSEFKPKETEAYTTAAFAELLYCAIDRFRNKDTDQKVVLVGHSLGCSISALLASSSSPLAYLCADKVVGFIAICPRAKSFSEEELISLKRLNYIPSQLFDLMRLADRRGGLDSTSVRRVVGKDADRETKKLQLRFNQQSKSAVFQKFCLAMHLQETVVAAKGQESLMGQRIWSGLKVPLFLVAAEDDKLAPPMQAEQIASWLTGNQGHMKAQAKDHDIAPLDGIQEGSIAPGDVPTSKDGAQSNGIAPLPTAAGDASNALEKLSSYSPSQLSGPNLNSHIAIKEEQTSSKHAFVLKTTIFPAPSSHGLLYATADVRILSGLMENFLATHIDTRLSPGWQLQHLTTSGKWDVKNLKKWQSIDPVSEPIAGVFRAMKTMREVDDGHCPKEFVRKFGHRTRPDGVVAVVDISHESPVYDKAGLEAGGVEYHKFPTVSKLPPTGDEVEHFIALIDGLRERFKMDTASSKATGGSEEDGTPHPTIAVHCHYGFNRTGFFVVTYLVERLGYRLPDALELFAEKRAPGIKHEYFVNELFVRYAVKMERRGTVVV